MVTTSAFRCVLKAMKMARLILKLCVDLRERPRAMHRVMKWCCGVQHLVLWSFHLSYVYHSTSMKWFLMRIMSSIPLSVVLVDIFDIACDLKVRWDVEPLLRNGESHCHVRIALDVSFSKKTMWKSK